MKRVSLVVALASCKLVFPDRTPKPPVDFKSVKICGATGLGVFVPIVETLGVGVAYTTYRLSYTQRAAQLVIALRFRF